MIVSRNSELNLYSSHNNKYILSIMIISQVVSEEQAIINCTKERYCGYVSLSPTK